MRTGSGSRRPGRGAAAIRGAAAAWLIGWVCAIGAPGQEPAPAAGAAGSSAEKPAVPDPRAGLPGPGWRWEMPPEDLPAGFARRGMSQMTPSGGLSLFVLKDSIVAQHARVTQLDARGSSRPEYNVILLDAAGGTIDQTMAFSYSNPKLSLATTYFPRDDESPPVKVGLAVLDLDGKRELAKLRLAEAAESGAKVVPLPVVGEALACELPALDGTAIDLAKHRGSWVLLDYWATW